MNFPRTAGIISQLLGHGCAPKESTIENVLTIDNLYAAMEKAFAENDSSFPCLEPWAHADDQRLVHTTKSGRMRIEVSDDSLVIELFSPAYDFGTTPFSKLNFLENEVTFTVVEEIVKGRSDRLQGIIMIIPAIMDLSEFLEKVICSQEEKTILLQIFLKKYEEEKDEEKIEICKGFLDGCFHSHIDFELVEKAYY